MKRVAGLTVLAGATALLACDAPDRVISSSKEAVFLVPALAFVSDRSGPPYIYLGSEDGTKVRPLTWGSHPAWSKEGLRIAFHRRTADGDGVYVVNVDGSGERRLAMGRDPVWMPGGREIVYAAEGGIYVIVADGTLQPRKVIGNDVVLPRLPGWDSSGYYAGWVESPTVSPDGRKITFARIDPINWDWGWERNTYIANADGSDPQLLDAGCGPRTSGVATFDACPVLDVAWSPDGSRLGVVTFDAPGGGGRSLVLASVGTDLNWAEKQVLHRASWYAPLNAIGRPHWSADGARMIFAAQPGGGFHDPTRIMVVSLEPAVPRQLIVDAALTVKAPYSDSYPVWFPGAFVDDGCPGCWDY